MTVMLIVCSMISLGTDATQYEKLEQAVGLATYESLEECIETNREITGCFEERIEKILEGRDYSIDEILGETEKGILSATVTLHYNNFGFDREVTCSRCVIYEREGV